MSDRNYIKSHQILKNLNAVLTYSVERYKNEFEWQEIRLTQEFKTVLKSYLAKKGADINYAEDIDLSTTTIKVQTGGTLVETHTKEIKPTQALPKGGMSDSK